MASAMPTTDGTVGVERGARDATATFTAVGITDTSAEDAPSGRPAADAGPRRRHPGAGHRTAEGSGRPP